MNGFVRAQTLDIYGGNQSSSCTVTGYFHTQKIGSQWWLCTPLGHLFWMQGVANILPDSHTTDLATTYQAIVITKYGNADLAWGPQQNRRLKSWGFNAVGEFSSNWTLPTATGFPGGDGTQPVKMPAIYQVQPALYAYYNPQSFSVPGLVKDVQSGINTAYYSGWNSSFPDLWDSNYTAWLDAQLAVMPKNSPWMIGWISDECDELYGLCAPGPDSTTYPPGVVQRHQALMVLMTAPNQNANGGRSFVIGAQTYSNSTVNIKSQLLTYLQSVYANIGLLNTAWGSSYTSFASTGTAVVGEAIGTGNGTQTSFSVTLAHTNVVPLSVAIKVAATLVGGDCANWEGGTCATGTGKGSFTGNTTITPHPNGGTITYATGVMTITFATAPANGAAITADYIHDGWSYGTGVMDEDGHHAWIAATNTQTLAGSTASFQADMNGFLQAISAQYFSITKTHIKTANPNIIYIGPGVMGTWGGTPSHYVLQGAAPYLELLPISAGGSTSAWTNALGTELNYIATYAGDIPIYVINGIMGTPDSALWRYGSDSNGTVNMQTDRASLANTEVSAFLTLTNNLGSRPIVGYRMWDFVDMWVEGGWGLVSLQDNAYDGVQSCNASITDPFGYTTFAEETVPAWAALTAYTVPSQVPSSGVKGNRIKATASDTNMYLYGATVAGTSGGSAPTWPTTVGGTVVDGTVTWQNLGRKLSSNCYGNYIGPLTTTNALWLANSPSNALPANRTFGSARVRGGGNMEIR